MMDDLISRQDAIGALQKEINKGIPPFNDVMGSIRCGVRLARNIIEDLPSARQWIPCSERLPEKFGDYLVSVKRHGWNCEEHIENDIAYWDDLEGFHKAEEVLAWMPLPEPWRGENE